MASHPSLSASLNRKVIPIMEQHWHSGRTLVAPLRPYYFGPEVLRVAPVFSFGERLLTSESESVVGTPTPVFIVKTTKKYTALGNIGSESVVAQATPVFEIKTSKKYTTLGQIASDSVSASAQPVFEIKTVIFLPPEVPREVIRGTASFSLEEV